MLQLTQNDDFNAFLKTTSLLNHQGYITKGSTGKFPNTDF